jgi:hypothetical protein
MQSSFALHFKSPPTANFVGHSGTGANINVTYHRINWTIDPNDATKTITGTIVTYFVTLTANVSSITFDLNSTSFPTANVTATYHGSACTRSCASNILTITLPSVIAASNTLDSVVVNYTGVPPAAVGQATGYQSAGSAPDNWIYTLAESYEDKDFWPCKADMQDKIDSMDINVTVPWKVATSDTFWVATNGKLIDSTITGNSRTFKFKTRYPIASYLVCVGVGKYNRYYRSVNIGGTNTPIVFYILRNTTSQATITAAMDKITGVLTAFSQKFGDYPFKLEKHGFYEGLAAGAGGMEHQTFSAIASGSELTNLQTLAHELMHQWFGDNVTFSTWNDLWLAEGFAQYSQALAYELVPSLGATTPYSIRSSIKSSALTLNNASAWIPNSNSGNSDLVWNAPYGSTVYKRGGMVVSMLRAICGDTKFFQACTNYQTARAGKSATTDTLKNYFNAVLGYDISNFFNDYIGGSGTTAAPVGTGGIGNPVNTVNWYSTSAKKLAIQITGQSQTSGSNVTYFNGPVVLHVKGTVPVTMDTTIVVYDWGGGNLSYAGNGLSAPIPGNLLTYNLSATPTSVKYDDSARTLSTGVITNNLIALATTILDFSAYKSTTGNDVKLLFNSTDPVTKVELQRSTNGIDFISAGEMSLINPGGPTLNYNFSDVNPFTSVTFYRAKIYSSGKEEFTNVVKIQSSNAKGITVSPNPADKEVRITFDNAARKEFTIRILNGEGKQIKETTINTGFMQIDISNFSSGIYMVQVMQQGQLSQTSKFIVRH